MAQLTVGLTGGIASGKSAVADELIRLGTPVVDGDQVARDIVSPGKPALEEIFEAFGEDFRQADGTLNRRKLRERVFSVPGDRKKLEAITHPRIRQGLLDWRDAQAAPYCVLAVPILVESGMDALVERVLVVDTTEELQFERLRARDGIDGQLAGSMLAAQASREQRLERADDVIRNEGSLASLRAATARINDFYLDIAKRGDLRAPGLHLP